MAGPELSWANAQDWPHGTRVVTDAEAAALLADPARRVHLHPFLDRTLSSAQAARELGLPLPRLHYWVKRLLDLKLIHVVDVRRRAGRPIQLYRSTAPAFFVPFAATSAETFEAKLVREECALQARLSAIQARALHASVDQPGTLMWREHEGMVRTIAHPRGDASEFVFNVWLERPLDRAQILALKAELVELVERYATLTVEGETRGTMLRVALASPEPDDRPTGSSPPG